MPSESGPEGIYSLSLLIILGVCGRRGKPRLVFADVWHVAIEEKQREILSPKWSSTSETSRGRKLVFPLR